MKRRRFHIWFANTRPSNINYKNCAVLVWSLVRTYVCVCVRVGGWLAGAANAISPKAINQTGSAVEFVQIGLINAAAERESGVFVCWCGMLEGERGAMEEVQEILLAFSLSSQQL